MATFRIPVAGDIAISQILSQIPEEARATFRRGYSLISKLADNQKDALVARAIEGLEEHSMSLPAELGKELGLDQEDGEAALGSLMLLTSALTTQPSRRPAMEGLIGTLANSKIIADEDVPKTQALFTALMSRANELEARMARLRLATRIFPAYERLATAVDLRVGSGEKRMAVVVGLVRVNTDENDRDLSF
jgi:hypothetical protein